ncbi:hypothetical protein [Halopseudomonas salegens]|uniref:Uncharacterized protein n=1 Tax=Halopseudomonas salegens TaxID=1434072 RepID=A0A1H2DZ87_9GAMM|nr:hypothetical protein [Halopseudomonas salegens]SDT88182.1 hypothetical protein SAMN05216210_0135 [Halopseudomonas salegens]
MLNCKQMSEMGSIIIDGQVPWRLKMSVMMHLSMCQRCSRYMQQLKLTSEVLQQSRLEADEAEIDLAISHLRR